MDQHFHILPQDAAYETVNFATPNPNLDPADYSYQTIRAACGAQLVRYQDEYCNIVIANPKWERNWCADCVRAFHWSEPDRIVWIRLHNIQPPTRPAPDAC